MAQPPLIIAIPNRIERTLPVNHLRSRRALALLKRSGLFGQEMHGAVIERACTVDDLRQAFKLVHDLYRRAGYINAARVGLRMRMFEADPNTATFVARRGAEIVGVLSTVADSPDLGLPSDAAFQTELDALRRNGGRLCEATNQVVREEFRKSAVTTELMRCAVAHITKTGYDQVLAAVSPSHQPFYDLLGFREVGSLRSYSDELEDPVLALSMDLDRYRRPAVAANEADQFVHRFLASENPFLERVSAWETTARQAFLSTPLLRQLFVDDSEFVARCSVRDRKILRRRWGRRLLARVVGQTWAGAARERITQFVCLLDTFDFRTSGLPSRRHLKLH